MNKKCLICKNNKFKKIYYGNIRDGVWGKFKKNASIYSCSKCKVDNLEKSFCVDDSIYYDSQYRKKLNQKTTLEDYYKNTDYYHKFFFDIMPSNNFRGKVVADFGCAGGGFLDHIKGLSKTNIAIEPSNIYQKSLKKKGYKTYLNIDKALKNYQNKVDIIICSSVVEHLSNPLTELKKLKKLLNKSGCMILSTPNRKDILLSIPKINFSSFFYRTVHRWYFDRNSLNFLLIKAGFKNNTPYFVHRYNLSNFINWIKFKKPMGNKINYKNYSKLDLIWKNFLQNKKISDYIFFKSF